MRERLIIITWYHKLKIFKLSTHKVCGMGCFQKLLRSRHALNLFRTRKMNAQDSFDLTCLIFCVFVSDMIDLSVCTWFAGSILRYCFARKSLSPTSHILSLYPVSFRFCRKSFNDTSGTIGSLADPCRRRINRSWKRSISKRSAGLPGRLDFLN